MKKKYILKSMNLNNVYKDPKGSIPGVGSLAPIILFFIVFGITSVVNASDFETYVKKAKESFEKKNYNEAITYYTNALKINYQFAEGFLERGTCYFYEREYDKAIEDYSGAIELNPKYAKAYYNRGTAYIEKHDYRKAVADYDKAIELNPKYIEAYVSCGNVYVSSNIFGGSISSGAKYYEKALSQYYNKAVELAPENPELYSLRANVYWYLGYIQEVLTDYTTAIRLEPANPERYYKRGCFLRNPMIGKQDDIKLDDAVADFSKAIELKPSEANYYYARGITYSYYGILKCDEAIADFDKVIDLESSDPMCLFSREFRGFMLLTYKKNYNKAIEDYTKVIECPPLTNDDFRASSYKMRGIAFYLLNKHREAIEDWKKSLDLNPVSSEIREWLKFNNNGEYDKVSQNCISHIEDCDLFGFLKKKQEHYSPYIVIVSPQNGQKFDQPSILLVVEAQEQQVGIDSIKVEVNGRTLSRGDIRKITVPEYRPGDKRVRQEYNINLNYGENIIKVRAYSTKNVTSEEQIIKVHRMPLKQKLWLLTIGINQYKDAKYNLTYAKPDVEEMVKLFRKQQGILYEEVNIKTIVDSEATRENIIKARYDFLDRASATDTVVIFFSGHGVKDSKSNYYFLTYDGEMDKPAIKGLSYADIKLNLLSALPCSNTLLLLDSCYSGTIAKGEEKEVQEKIIDLTKEKVIVISASTSQGYATEHKEWGNGAFTYCIKKAFEGEADRDNDKTISVKELYFYVSRKVIEITKQMQHPTGPDPDKIGMSDFKIYILK